MENEKSINIEKLNNKNWSNWKFRMELILKEHDLFNIITGVETVDNRKGKRSEFPERADKAFRLIALAVSDQYLCVLRRAGTAIEAWKVLKENFERICLSNQIALWKRFVHLKYDNKEDMQIHINNLTELKTQLEAIGYIVNDIMMVMVLFDSLPTDYENLIIALEAQKGTIDFEFASSRVLEEYERQKMLKNNEGGDVVALSIKYKNKFKKFTGKCNYCHKIGHKAVDCFKRKANEKQDDKNRDYKSKVNLVESEYKALLAFHMDNQDDDWLIDSGATNHMCSNKICFVNYETVHGRDVIIADGRKVPIIGKGDVVIQDSNTNRILKLTDVLHVPQLKQNLLSVVKAISNGIRVVFTGNHAIGSDDDGIVFQANLINESFKVKNVLSNKSYHVIEDNDEHGNQEKDQNCELVNLLNKRLGHIGKTGLSKLINKKLLTIKATKEIDCLSCILVNRIVRRSLNQLVKLLIYLNS